MIYALFITDNFGFLDAERDATLHIVDTALQIGWDVSAADYESLHCTRESIVVDTADVGGRGLSAKRRQLKEFDVVFIRIDPPVDLRFISLMQILCDPDLPCLFVNSPRALLHWPEKLLPKALGLPRPSSIVTHSVADVRDFAREVGKVVVKPMYDYRGAGIYVTGSEDRNLTSVFESIRSRYAGAPLIAQRYLPEIEQGDRRVFVVGGVPVAAINRRCDPLEYRANMAVGGIAEPYFLSQEEEVLLARVGSELIRMGIPLAGVDLIGNLVTEVNFTAPTGHIQVEELLGVNVSAVVCEWVEGEVRRRRQD